MKRLFVVVLLVCLPLFSWVGCTGGTSDDGAESPDGGFDPVGFADEIEPTPNTPADVTSGDDAVADEPDIEPLPLDIEALPLDSESEDTASEPVPEDTVVEDPPDEVPANASTILNSQFPTAMSCGDIASVSVEVLNTGTATWTREAGYKLGTVDDEDPFHETTREWLPDDAVIPPNTSWVFEFELKAPTSKGLYTTDWRMVQEGVEWFGDMVAHDISVTCPDPPECDLDDAMKASVLQSATYVRDNYPEFFDLEDLPNDTKRAIAYDMMTTVINDLRSKGVNASRCIANPGLPPSDPFLWCSDALVICSPGQGFTIDIYWSWSFPATPQVAVTETESTGDVTDDLIPLP